MRLSAGIAREMTITVCLFARFRELVGESRLRLEVDHGATPSEVYSLIQFRQPAVGPLRPFTTFAVNREVVDADTPLRDGDEIAFLQPVSGGGND